MGELGVPCGRCDNCLVQRSPRDWSEQAALLLAAVAKDGASGLRGVSSELATGHGSDEQRWAWLARRLVQEELIAESDDGSQRLWLRPVGQSYLRSPWPLHWAA